MTYVIGALAAVSVLEICLMCRVMARVAAIGRIEDRVSSLTHTIALLTDTTETCFTTIAAQLEAGPAARPARTRAARQRRVVGAASSGRTVTEIAAEESLSESEVRLRLQMARPPAPQEGPRHGAMRS